MRQTATHEYDDTNALTSIVSRNGLLRSFECDSDGRIDLENGEMKNIKSRLSYLALVVLGTVLCLSVIVKVASEKQDWKTKAENVKVGMTLAEVIGVIGVPPGDYANGHDYSTPRVDLPSAPDPGLTEWKSNEGVIAIQLDHFNRVESVSYLPRTDFALWEKTLNWILNL